MKTTILGTTLEGETRDEWRWNEESSCVQSWIYQGIKISVAEGPQNRELMQNVQRITNAVYRELGKPKITRNIVDLRAADFPPLADAIRIAWAHLHSPPMHNGVTIAIVGPLFRSMYLAAKVLRPATVANISLATCVEDAIHQMENHSLPSENFVDDDFRPSSRTDLAFLLKRKIDNGPEQPLRIGDFCEAKGIGRTSLWDQFRREFGMSPKQYHVQQKVKLAIPKLIEQCDMATIAKECGFSDSSHFSRSFRKVMGENPSEFRSRERANSMEDAKKITRHIR